LVGFLAGYWIAPGLAAKGPQWAGVLAAAVEDEHEALEDEELTGPCHATRIVDGDTLDVECGDLESDRVRLLQIDTPERGQRGYYEATEALRDLVDGEDLYLGFEEPGQISRGRYGRLLAYVFTDDDEDVNEEMIREGWSGYWTKYGAGRFPNTMWSADVEARLNHNGLWAR
jgi:micrococcal nuclease